MEIQISSTKAVSKKDDLTRKPNRALDALEKKKKKKNLSSGIFFFSAQSSHLHHYFQGVVTAPAD